MIGRGYRDPAGTYLPLVYQTRDTPDHSLNTTVLEQPLDFSTLDEKYNNFVKDFVTKHKDSPFFLYMPFSHVHTTNTLQPEEQYCGCDFKNKTSRGAFGDALAEVDWLVGNLIEQLELLGLSENTLIDKKRDNYVHFLAEKLHEIFLINNYSHVPPISMLAH